MPNLVVTHTKVSGKAAGTDPDRVYGSHWDETHTIVGLENVDNTSDATKNSTVATLTNKTEIAPVIVSPIITGTQALGIRDGTSGGFDLQIAGNEALTAHRKLSIKLNDANRTLNMGGNITIAGALTTVGAFATIIRTTAATDLTAPTTGTLATLAGTEAFTNKTYNGNIWTAGTGVLTLAAGKTLTASNTLTFTGTDASSIAFGAGGTVAYISNKLSAFAATTSAELAGVISDETGSGSLVFATSPTLTTPALGTPSAIVLTNATGLPLGALSGLGTGVATFLATPSSVNLKSALTDETGSGAAVFANSPALVTPTGIVKGDVGLGNVANVDTTNATNISSGTLPAARLPNPSASTLGGVQSIAAVTSNWVRSISTSGVPALSQPAASDLSNGTSGAGLVVLATTPTISAPAVTAVQSFGLRAGITGGFDLQFSGGEALTNHRQWTLILNDVARTLNMGGNITTAAAFATSGANSLTLTTTGSTNVTLPTSGTLATLSSSVPAPQGRLTLVTATPVMTTTQSAKTTLYYTPYVGAIVSIYDGTNMLATAFTELSIATTDTTKNPAAIGASKVNDWFIWNDGGTLRLSHGPDWTDDLTRSAGTALTRVNGVLLNNASITNGPAASRGTYVGTTRSNASSQLDWTLGTIATGGGAALLNVWNAYNRVNVATSVGDDADTWNTVGTAAWENFHASAANRISFVMGLAEDSVQADLNSLMTASASGNAALGIGLNSSTAFSGSPGFAAATTLTHQRSLYSGTPPLGYNYLQAIQYSAAGTAVFRGDGGAPAYSQALLSATLRM